MRKFALSVLTTTIFCLAIFSPAYAADPDTTPPKMTDLKLTNKVFALGTKNTALISKKSKTKVPVGTTIKFTLDSNAYVTIGVYKALDGVEQGLDCVKINDSNKDGKKCVRPVYINAMQRIGRAGVNKVAFSGILDGKKLHTGAYAFGLIASDEAGNATTIVTRQFKIVKGK